MNRDQHVDVSQFQERNEFVTQKRSMSSKKKAIREAFRATVFERDGNKCRMCGGIPVEDEHHLAVWHLDAHHITDRTLMPNGGYVEANGITLCPWCHEKAEVYHSTGQALPGWSPEDLYTIVGSTYDEAVKASERLK